MSTPSTVIISEVTEANIVVEKVVVDISAQGVPGAPGEGVEAHLTDTTGAHAASAISFTPTGGLTADNVQAAIAEAATLGGTGVELGETSTTAYRGDRGKIAYDHSQVTGNPHGTTAAQVGADPTGTAASAVTAHEAGGDVHSIAGVSGLQSALDGKQATGDYALNSALASYLLTATWNEGVIPISATNLQWTDASSPLTRPNGNALVEGDEVRRSDLNGLIARWNGTYWLAGEHRINNQATNLAVLASGAGGIAATLPMVGVNYFIQSIELLRMDVIQGWNLTLRGGGNIQNDFFTLQKITGKQPVNVAIIGNYGDVYTNGFPRFNVYAAKNGATQNFFVANVTAIISDIIL